MDKRDRERAILDMIYASHEFALVQHQDSPDFLLKHHGVDAAFGVEVTELYENEADARAEHHPEYIGRLFEGHPHMHKDDIQALAVSRVTVREPNGRIKHEDLPAIIRQHPPSEERYNALADTLERKHRRFHDYKDGLTHVNLIVMDRFPSIEEGEYASAEVFVPRLRQALRNAEFREVFLIQSVFGGMTVYKPLQGLMLLESFYLFYACLGSFSRIQELVGVDLIQLFIYLANQDGMDVQRGYKFAGTPCATYRGYGVLPSDEGVQLLDFRDKRPPLDPDGPPDLRVSSDLLRALAAHYRSVAESNTFVSEVAINCVGMGSSERDGH